MKNSSEYEVCDMRRWYTVCMSRCMSDRSTKSHSWSWSHDVVSSLVTHNILFSFCWRWRCVGKWDGMGWVSSADEPDEDGRNNILYLRCTKQTFVSLVGNRMDITMTFGKFVFLRIFFLFFFLFLLLSCRGAFLFFFTFMLHTQSVSVAIAEKLFIFLWIHELMCLAFIYVYSLLLSLCP